MFPATQCICCCSLVVYKPNFEETGLQLLTFTSTTDSKTLQNIINNKQNTCLRSHVTLQYSSRRWAGPRLSLSAERLNMISLCQQMFGCFGRPAEFPWSLLTWDTHWGGAPCSLTATQQPSTPSSSRGELEINNTSHHCWSFNKSSFHSGIKWLDGFITALQRPQIQDLFLFIVRAFKL